ncbi:MAG: oxygen-independent coproporphyrinogen III oxidase-like protein [Gammaproteobacteria bacterium]|nr:oxygen-independent coproporphyrinogen III oxidase-like protein [Gammaproteobacteria bacterium]
MFNFSALPPLSLYIHMPWCVRKCPYCDFNSHAVIEPIPEADYINALIADLEQALPSVWGRTLQTIFIGGGTPSLFSGDAIATLLSAVRARLPVRPDIEITLEANPGTLEAGRFRAYREAGVNRLSIGVQSFDDDILQRLGRVHDGSQAVAAVQEAKSAGFERINLDLMFGLPGQSLVQAMDDVDRAIELAPDHISYYQLTVEPNTAFHHQPPSLPDDDEIWQFQAQGCERLAAAGYAQYEISAYAQDGKQCRHNLNYWSFGDYIGIGAGAHGKITRADTQQIGRYWKAKHPRDYLLQTPLQQTSRVAGEKTVRRDEVGLEFMMNVLRLTDGFPSSLFYEHTGMPLKIVDEALNEAQHRGLIEWDIQRIQPTQQGQRFLNDLLELFVSTPR